MFLDCFNDIRIARYQSDGSTVRKYIDVPLKFGPKQKTYYWIKERKADEILPIMSATLQAVEYAQDRQVNKSAKVVKSGLSETTVARFLNPVPYNLIMQLSLWGLHMIDIDQILEQILPYFTPFVMTQINIPEIDATMDVKIVFNTCSPDVTFEMADEERRILIWNLDFTIQGYLFTPVTDSAIIREIILNWYTNAARFNARDTSSVFVTGAPLSGATATMWLSGIGYDNDGEILHLYEVYE